VRVPVGGARMLVPARAAAMAWSVAWGAAAVGPASAQVAAPTVEVQQGDGSVSAGRLLGVDPLEVRLAEAAGGAVALPVERVRTLRVTDGAAAGEGRVLVTLVDGSTLSGDEFTWDGTSAAQLARPEGGIEIPAARVRSVAVRPNGGGGAAAAQWQAAIPEGASSDLVVVGSEASHEFVECAITAVSPETVTVILDEETIPVKRTKVIGMQWLRTDAGAAQGRLAVAVAGGQLRGDRVEWSPDGLVVDGELRLPASMLSGVDYASGRTVGLATLAAEKVVVEPWFGGLGRGDGLEAFFAPRAIAPQVTTGRPDAAARSSLLMRPRTVASWRLPPDGRRFRTVLIPAGGPQAADPVIVAVAVDDRELFRKQVDGSAAVAAESGPPDAIGIPVDVDITGGRRLTVTVDFGSSGGIGGPVVFTLPVIER